MSFFHRGWCHHKFQAIWFNSCQKNFVLTDCIFSFGFITFVICFRARMTQLIGTTVLFDLSVWAKKTESWRKLLQEYILWNVSKYGVFTGLYFPAFGLNTERHWVFLLRIFPRSDWIRKDNEFFLVRILPQLDWIRRDTQCLSVFSLNAGKYGPEKTLYLDTFDSVTST